MNVNHFRMTTKRPGRPNLGRALPTCTKVTVKKSAFGKDRRPWVWRFFLININQLEPGPHLMVLMFCAERR